MHGLVTGQTPSRRGDLELKLEPTGLFESERLVEINDRLLQVLGCQWDRPPLSPHHLGSAPLFGLQPHRSRLESYALDMLSRQGSPSLHHLFCIFAYFIAPYSTCGGPA